MRDGIFSTACSLLLLIGQLGCAASQVVEVPPPEPLNPRQQVRVWQGKEAVTLHGVVFAADTLHGIPYLEPLSCDSCAIALPLAAVDSVGLVNTERPAMIGTALPFVALAVVMVVWRISAGGD